MSNNPPGYFKDNPLTRSMDRVTQLNAEFGFRAAGGGVPRQVLREVAPVPAPAPESAGLMQSGVSETGEGGIRAAPPLDPESARQLEAEWAAQTGQRVGELDPDEAEAEDGYDLSTRPDVPVGRVLHGRPGGAESRMTAREAITTMRVPVMVQPNFTKLENVDLVSNEVSVGGVRFPLGGKERAEIANIIVRVVREAIIRDLEAALGNEVQPVPEAGGTGTVGVPEVPGA